MRHLVCRELLLQELKCVAKARMLVFADIEENISPQLQRVIMEANILTNVDSYVFQNCQKLFLACRLLLVE